MSFVPVGALILPLLYRGESPYTILREASVITEEEALQNFVAFTSIHLQHQIAILQLAVFADANLDLSEGDDLSTSLDDRNSLF